MSTPKDMPESEIESLKELQPVFWWAHKAVTGVASVLAGAFIWLQWRNYHLPPDVVDRISESVITKVALGIYYCSWIFACRFDLKIQESVYLIDPNRGALPKSFFWLTPLFLLVASALLWAAEPNVPIFGIRLSDWLHHNREAYYLAIIVSIFFGVDTVLWVFTRRWSLPIAIATKEHFASSPNRCFYWEKIHVAQELMCGNYQIYRHIAIFALIAGFDVIAFFDGPRTYVSTFIRWFKPELSVESINKLLPAAALLFYVLVCEGSMWFMRARAHLSLDTIERLQKKYELIAR